MRHPRRTFLVTAAAAMAAVLTYASLTLPPASRLLSPAPPTTLYGAFHVHTNRSDGSGSVDDVAAAAQAAGLQFVIVSDHGDATRPPDPPQYRHGVLVIDAVEVSTKAGHLVVLGLDEPSPYPLGANAWDTLEDVHRLGGWAVAAHPDSPKVDLQWSEPAAPVDGLEWLNADSEWRDEAVAALLLAIPHYFVRPAEAVAALFDRPALSLHRWDALLATRAVVALAGVDAHARIGPDDTAGSVRKGAGLARPSYQDMFRTAVQAVDLPAAPSNDPVSDATAILTALGGGDTYSVVVAQASPGRVAFSASARGATRRMGQSLETDDPVHVMASVPEPDDATVALFRNGEEVASGLGRVSFDHDGGSASFRVEVRLPGHVVPWIVTNAIRVGSALPALPVASDPKPTLVRALADHGAWAVEKQTDSAASVSVGADGVVLDFQLAGGPADGQYAAVAYPLDGVDLFDSITLTVRASAPMRASLQLRVPASADGKKEARWQKSIYIDTAPREVTLRLRDFEPVSSVVDQIPPVAWVRSLLLVADTWHTRPGTQGQLWVSGISLGTQGRQGTVTSAR